jgi:hypothetical protein
MISRKTRGHKPPLQKEHSLHRKITRMRCGEKAQRQRSVIVSCFLLSEFPASGEFAVQESESFNPKDGSSLDIVHQKVLVERIPIGRWNLLPVQKHVSYNQLFCCPAVYVGGQPMHFRHLGFRGTSIYPAGIIIEKGRCRSSQFGLLSASYGANENPVRAPAV